MARCAENAGGGAVSETTGGGCRSAYKTKPAARATSPSAVKREAARRDQAMWIFLGRRYFTFFPGELLPFWCSTSCVTLPLASRVKEICASTALRKNLSTAS